MPVSYDKLWKMLIDKNIRDKELNFQKIFNINMIILKQNYQS